jgi:hypothetical protein
MEGGIFEGRGGSTISVLCLRGWSSVSWWQSAQSNHFRPVVTLEKKRGLEG